MHQPNRYRFHATVAKQVSARRWMLTDVCNLDLKRPFRYHLWIDTHKNNMFRRYGEVTFIATVHLYRKRSGKLRFGLRDFEIIQHGGNRL